MRVTATLREHGRRHSDALGWVTRVRLCAAAVVAALATSLTSPASATAPTPPPSHHLGTKPAVDPAAKDLAVQVGRLQALVHDLHGAQRTLAPLQVTAEAATRQWRTAEAALKTARTHQRVADAAAAAAKARLEAQQTAVDEVAAAAYMEGANSLTWVSAMTSTDPTDLLTRNATLSVIARQQGAQLDLLGALRAQADETAAAAMSATAEVAATDAAATKARATAVAAMMKQQTVVHDLITRQARVRADVQKVLSSAHGDQLNALLRQLADALKTLETTVSGVDAGMAEVSMLLPVASAKQGTRALARARTQLGQPYSWGGGNASGPTLGKVTPDGDKAGLTTRGFDCSGLVLYAWAKEGFTLDHFTGFQWFEGRPVARDQLRPGDLVFFATNPKDPATIHHVGIYAGNGMMIDAPHTGAKVRFDAVWSAQYAGAIRP